MNWKHYAMVALAGVAAGAVTVAQSDAHLAPAMGVVEAVCQAATMVLGMISGAAFGKDASK